MCILSCNKTIYNDDLVSNDSKFGATRFGRLLKLKHLSNYVTQLFFIEKREIMIMLTKKFPKLERKKKRAPNTEMN